SGVRSSQDPERLAAALSAPAASPVRPLTYSMYTISDLDAGDAKAVRLAPERSPDLETAARWRALSNATRAAVPCLIAFARLPSPRPPLREFSRAPKERFVGELGRVIAAIRWRRLALGLAVAAGSL